MTPHRLPAALRIVCFTLIFFPLLTKADTATDIRNFTGAPTRVVWIQDAGDKANVYSEHPTIRLMGFDTEDGKGERPILPDIGWYAKPLLTADGNRVVFANIADHSVDVVNFDGTGLRQILKNDDSYKYDEKPFIDDAVWTDPKSGVTWVYALIMDQRGSQQVPTIRRYQLDNPKVSELIWDKTPLYMFMPSGDGRAASGGIVDGGNSSQGLFTLPNGNYIVRHNGCWPSMAPDASHRMWVFTGSHNGIGLFTQTNRNGGSSNSRLILFAAPGLVTNGGDEMYHPRWTNNVHFLTMDSPFPHKAWNFKSDTKIPQDVAANVEIYIGKFKDDFTGIEQWIQVTHNKLGDYWPNVWIKPSQADLAALASAPEVPEEKAPATLDTKGEVYMWQTGADGNQIVNPATGAIHVCSGQFRDSARFARFHVMDLTDGAFVPDNGSADPLLAACKASNQFALETEITPTGIPSTDEKAIMAFADDAANGNFVLAQQGDSLTFRLKTDGSADSETLARPVRIYSLVQGQTYHVIVSYADSKLACYVNGKQAVIPNPFHGKLSGWTMQPLIFGDAWKGGKNWPGLMEDIGLFSREIGAGEARQRYLKQRERTKARKPVETVIMDAKLIGRTPAADPRGIAPYRRCLCEQLYEVVKVISGTCPDPKITVAQWSVLDAKVVPSYEKLAVGQTYRMALEKMDDHPEQDSERNNTGDFDATTTPLYYEVRMPDAAQTAPKATQSGEPGNTIVTNPSIDELTSKGTVKMAGHGAVTAAVVTDGGFDYTHAPEVQFSGGGGQGASGEAVLGLASLEVTNVGQSYTSEPAVTVSEPDVAGGRQATVTAQIDKAGGTVSGLTITDPGTGYLRIPKITFAGGGGTGAEAQATLSLAGIVFTNGGSGYTSPPKITLNGGDGQQAQAQTVLESKTLRFTDPAANALFTNAGSLEQDGAALLFDWAAANRPTGPTGKCGINNAGAWTLKNASSVLFTSSAGRTSMVGDGSGNAGAMSVLDHSRLGFSRFQNSGTLELGAGAVLGQSEYAAVDNTLANADMGVIKITGGSRDEPATFGYTGPNGTGKRIIENGVNRRSNPAQLIVGSGTDAATFAIIGGRVDVNNYPGAHIEIQPGAMLALLTNDNGDTQPTGNSMPREARLMNAGALLLAGQMRLQSNHAAFTGIENSGTLTIRGDQAGVDRLPNSAGPGSLYETRYAAQILNQHGGLVQGTGTLAYTNSTGTAEGRFLRIYNSGIIAPGSGTANGTESFGSLALRNVNVRFGGYVYPQRPPGSPNNGPTPAPIASTPPQAGTLQIAIGGPPTASGRYDTLTLAGPDDCGQLEFIKGDGNTLNIVTAAGFAPHGTYRIVTATSVVGTFDTLQYNGAPQPPYTVNYLPNGIEVVFP